MKPWPDDMRWHRGRYWDRTAGDRNGKLKSSDHHQYYDMFLHNRHRGLFNMSFPMALYPKLPARRKEIDFWS